MKDSAVITLPLSPVKNKEYSRLVIPVIGETLSKVLDANFYLCTNVLDSFNKRDESYLLYKKMIDEHHIKYHELWKDDDNLDRLIKNIYSLIEKGYIYEIETQILKCDCGVIEIEKKNIKTCNMDNTHFVIDNNEIRCSKCDSICKEEKTKVLVFDSSRFETNEFNFFPLYLNKDIKSYNNTILSSYVVISRNRNTGVVINYNNSLYNIDIDFLWQTYLNLFEEKNKIVLSGNKQIYQLLLTGIISKCLDSDSNIIFVGNPIINKINDYNFNAECEDDLLVKKLAIIFNAKWAAKEREFDSGLLNYLKKMSNEKRKQLYDIVCGCSFNENVDFKKNVDVAINNSFNMQQCVKKLKKERRKNV